MSTSPTPDFNLYSQKNNPMGYLLAERGIGSSNAQTTQAPLKAPKLPAKADNIAPIEGAPDLAILSPNKETPQLPHPQSHKSLNDAIDHVLITLPPSAKNESKKSPKKATNKGTPQQAAPQQGKAKQGATQNVLSSSPPSTPPNSGDQASENGIAEFNLINALITSALKNQQQVEDKVASEMSQVSLSQMETLLNESEELEALEHAAFGDQDSVNNLNQEISDKQGDLNSLNQEFLNQPNMPNISVWNESNWKWFWNEAGTPTFADELWQQFPSVFDDVKNAVNSGTNILGVLIADEEKNPGLSTLLSQFFPTFFNSSGSTPSLAQQYATDQGDINGYQTAINSLNSQIAALPQELDKATTQFMAALRAAGITNVTLGNLPDIISLLKTAYLQKKMIESAVSGNALSEFTLVKNALTIASQQLQIDFGSSCNQLNTSSEMVANTILGLTQQMNTNLAEIRSQQTQASEVSKAIMRVTYAVAAASLLLAAVSFLSSWFPVLAPVATFLGYVVAGLTVTLAGLLLERGFLAIEIADEEKNVAKEKERIALLTNSNEYTQQVAQNLTEGLAAMAKKMQQMIQDGDQAYANIRAASPQ
jgi:hypothetical protein